jgi:hypothetical protein
MQLRGKILLNASAVSCGLALCGFVPASHAGPYSAALHDPANPEDAPVPGFVGPHGIGKARLDTFTFDDNGEPVFENPENFVNPLFFAWADSVENYQPSESVSAGFADPAAALGPVTGDNFHVVALGDLSAGASPPGTITVRLSKPIRNLTGADFVVFENGHIAEFNYGGAGIGGIFGELAHVWVSADGENFVRFPAASLTAAPVGAYGSLDPSNLKNLAGKHTNAFGDCWGTPFDLADVNLSEITHIRLVDIPGDGRVIDDSGLPIYDPWKTFGSGGFDLEAVGAISTPMTYAQWPALENVAPELQGMADDPDGDGLPNLLEYAFARVPSLPDAAEALPKIRLVATGDETFPELTFLRDERLTDLVYEVQASSSLAGNSWTTIARSTAGGPLLPAADHQPLIAETSASSIASVGVIRRVTVRDAAPVTAASTRFLRVKVTASPTEP